MNRLDGNNCAAAHAGLMSAALQSRDATSFKWYPLWPKKVRKNITTTQSLNDRWPLKNSSYAPQTLGKRVSDDSRHFIFRVPTKKIQIFCTYLTFFARVSYYFEELRFFGRHWHFRHEKLHHIDLLSFLYDPKSGFPSSVKFRRICFSNYFWPQTVLTAINSQLRRTVCVQRCKRTAALAPFCYLLQHDEKKRK